ncbi:polysaccharide biosynthesis PFTS motif protein [Aquirufa ecclesiirivi]|nr:polysaccharide biosynthesis PFTS motif protein [Aquirufa ecclesiirivi]
MMRGYRQLKSENRLDFILQLKFNISNTAISSVGKNPAQWVFGAGGDSAELIVRQYLVSRLLELNFNKEILYCFGDQQRAFSYPLPPSWLQIVKNSGIKVNFFTSFLKFRWYVFTCFIGGFAVFGKHLLSCIQEIRKPNHTQAKPYVYFDGLVASNIPKSNSKPSYDIISWYLQWSHKEIGISHILHRAGSAAEVIIDGITIKPVLSTIKPITKISSILGYISWFIFGMVLSWLSFFRDRWWNALMMMEAVKAKTVQYLDTTEIAKDYLFHNSGWVYRPLWTYEAEVKGANITFYFYSRNCENFKLPQGYPIQANFWDITNWPRYLVWNESHEDFIYRCVSKNAKVLNVGSIWFQDDSNVEFQIPENSVAVFPVQPLRDSFYQSLGIDFEYYVSINSNQFLEDCHQIVKDQQGILVLKNKRDVGKLLSKSFSKLINTLELNVDVINLDSRISANRVIQHSKAVISMPFTSTALIAKELGKPTCYYDPLGMIQKDDRASSGIEIVTGKKELASWLSKVL